MANPLRVNTAELLRRSGSERIVDVTMTVAELGLVDERFLAPDPVAIRLRLESLTDGVVVAGTVAVDWRGVCRRCATDAGGTLCTEIHELYQETVSDPEAFPLEGEQLDLGPMIREALVLDAPFTPLCRDDCAGLCPICGIDLNVETCACAAPAADHRWSALDQFKASVDNRFSVDNRLGDDLAPGPTGE